MNAVYKQDALRRFKTCAGRRARAPGRRDPDGRGRSLLPELMKQIAAAQASLERVNRILLQSHPETCVTEAIRAGGGAPKIAELIDTLRYNGSLTDFRERAEPLASPPSDTAVG